MLLRHIGLITKLFIALFKSDTLTWGDTSVVPSPTDQYANVTLSDIVLSMTYIVYIFLMAPLLADDFHV